MAECGENYLDCTKHNESVESIFKRLISIDDDGNLALNICGCDCSGGGLTSVTYDELVALIDSAGLTPGAFYLLTDFNTVHYFTDGTTTLADINTGALEQLILLAINPAQINSRVWSTVYPQDVLHYDWNPFNWVNDISFSLDTVNIVTGWKGVITYRWDTKQDNSTGYDFRNVMFRRWAIDEVGSEFDNLYYSWQSTEVNGLGVDPDDSEDYYTFETYASCWGNHIGGNTITDTNNSYLTILNNIVFFSVNEEGTIYCAYYNTFEQGCYQSTVGNIFYGNKIDQYFYNNIIGAGCYANSIMQYFFSNVIGSNFRGNFVMSNCNQNMIGTGFSGCSIGNYFSQNTVGDSATMNTILDKVQGTDFTADLHVPASYSYTIQVCNNSTVVGCYLDCAGLPTPTYVVISAI